MLTRFRLTPPMEPSTFIDNVIHDTGSDRAETNVKWASSAIPGETDYVWNNISYNILGTHGR